MNPKVKMSLLKTNKIIKSKCESRSHTFDENLYNLFIPRDILRSLRDDIKDYEKVKFRSIYLSKGTWLKQIRLHKGISSTSAGGAVVLAEKK